MQTVTYYILKNDKGKYLTSDGDCVSIDKCELAASWESAYFARRSPLYSAGIRVVKVTRKIKLKTYSRAWAVKQVLKGKKVTNRAADAGNYIKLDGGFFWFAPDGGCCSAAYFSDEDGYYLVP